MPADRPLLAVIALSDSFSSAWVSLAEEQELQLDRLDPSDPARTGTAVVLVAAGGEEERALDLLPSIIGHSGDAPVYLVGALPSHRFAVEAIRRGAADYFALPGDVALLGRTVATRVQSARQRARRAESPGSDPFRTLVGTSAPLRQTLELARRVLQHDGVTVLVTGETGTGKELLARALHEGGSRAPGPFVAVNCAAIPGNLLESELFGHERGAFTDAYQTKPGLFEEAHGGTLFLDEVGHLPLQLQGKLLRVLDEKRIRRVGGNQVRDVDVRIVAATNVDLSAAAGRGEFRDDLYYRLNVVSLALPPLRERGDDIFLLAETFIAALSKRYEIPAPALSGDVRHALSAHTWPGNVRELRHAIERSLILSEPGTLDPAQLAPAKRAERGANGGSGATIEAIVLAAAQAALADCGGNRTLAASRLGISRQRLLRILRKADDGDA